MTLQAQLLIALALLLGGVGIGWKLGVDSEKADQLDTVTTALGQFVENAKTSSDVGVETRAAGGAQQVTTQTQTEAGNERIRKVYIPVAADCFQPPDVVRELQASSESTNRAVRAAAGVADPGDPNGRAVQRH